jgi:mannose-1-phosphate guanylyltransferase
MTQLIVYIDLPEDHKIDEEPKFMEAIRKTITTLEMNDQVTYWEWEIH